jgi:nitroimidazol reductase NimA-like FMN-containing flavoprotein (pyridoxamine 5'-phosphate oxidase superfamily)
MDFSRWSQMLEMTGLEIDEMLEESLIGRLSMASCDGRPYSVPLPFCWLDGALYLRLPLTGRKGQVLSENNQVCFEIDQFTQSLDEYASVLVEGRLVEVMDLDEKARVKAINDDKYNRLRAGYRPGHHRPSELWRLPLRKIQVIALSGRKKETAQPPVLVGTASRL